MVALDSGLSTVGKHLSRVGVDFIARKYGVAPSERVQQAHLTFRLAQQNSWFDGSSSCGDKDTEQSLFTDGESRRRLIPF